MLLVAKSDGQDDFTQAELAVLAPAGIHEKMWTGREASPTHPTQRRTYVAVNASDETDAKRKVADLLGIEPSQLRALAAGPDRQTEH
jgi:hypothetical protein